MARNGKTSKRVAPKPSKIWRSKTGSKLHPVKFLEDRYQGLIGKYYETGKSPLPCTALSSSCFVDAYWNLYACSIWDAKVGNLRENGFDLKALWDSDTRRELRADVVEERCTHCWTPCEAYPSILGNLARAAVSRSRDLEPATAESV